jgi:hypothetical protein
LYKLYRGVLSGHSELAPHLSPPMRSSICWHRPASTRQRRGSRSYRSADRQKAFDFGAQEFVDVDNDALDDVGGVDLAFDVIGGDIQKRSVGLIRAGGSLVSVVGPAEAAHGRPSDRLLCRVRSWPTE